MALPWIHRGNVLEVIERAVEAHRAAHPDTRNAYWTDPFFQRTFPTTDYDRQVEGVVFGALGWILLAGFGDEIQDPHVLDDAKLGAAEMGSRTSGIPYYLWQPWDIEGRPLFEREPENERGLPYPRILHIVDLAIAAACETNRDEAVEVARNVIEAAIKAAEDDAAVLAAETASRAEYAEPLTGPEQNLLTMLTAPTDARFSRIIDEAIRSRKAAGAVATPGS